MNNKAIIFFIFVGLSNRALASEKKMVVYDLVMISSNEKKIAQKKNQCILSAQNKTADIKHSSNGTMCYITPLQNPHNKKGYFYEISDVNTKYIITSKKAIDIETVFSKEKILLAQAILPSNKIMQIIMPTIYKHDLEERKWLEEQEWISKFPVKTADIVQKPGSTNKQPVHSDKKARNSILKYTCLAAFCVICLYNFEKIQTQFAQFMNTSFLNFFTQK